MREIVLDTETTGLDPNSGHRIVEIGCLELINHVPTGKTYHQYVNPLRDMPTEAFNVHGLSNEFLSTHPPFEAIMDAFLDFIQESPLIIHNAKFDMKFINAELVLQKKSPLLMTRTIDTVQMARKKFPGSPANLDALCRRFKIDNSNRTLHGALLDSELLAEVYLELIGGKQPGLNFIDKRVTQLENKKQQESSAETKIIPARQFDFFKDDLKAHAEMLDEIEDPLWKKLG